MTADERTDKLEQRVDRLEDAYKADVSAIHTKLDALVTAVNNHMVTAVKRECPSPGACIGLSENLKGQITAHNATMLRVERLELRMMDLEKWQGRMLGGIAVLMVVLTLFGESLRQLLRLS
jgi:hypothetical protein